VQQGTTSAANLRDYDRHLGLGLKIVESSSSDDRTSRFVRRECDLMTGDRSELAAQRVAKALDPVRWRLLDETISREPLGPYVADSDPRWFALVRWAVLIPQIAEMRGVSARELAGITAKDDGELRRLAGLEKDFGKPLGLDDAWARRIVEQVGHYGEIFRRHLGAESPFRLERGPNQPVAAGGWLFPPPLR
jgi:general L-amino acid transport system substrate-binding protein